LQEVAAWRSIFDREQIGPGSVVAFEARYSPRSCALLLALLEQRAIAVPTPWSDGDDPSRLDVACARAMIRLDESDSFRVERHDSTATHPLLQALRAERRAGLILFSSGSTGRAKAAVLDFDQMLEKFVKSRRAFRTLTFLLFDHIGGIDATFAALSGGGTLIVDEIRTPKSVCATIEAHRVEVLPTSPTFLRMLLMSKAHERHDLSSLRVIAYGTEPMHPTTLRALHNAFPTAQLKQTYGLTEVGALRTQSRANDSLWVRIEGHHVNWKVESGVLWIRALSATRGYLNESTPFDKEGWMNTGDAVEVDGDYLLIKGRATEIINVGGLKVYPAEVEDVLIQISNVLAATVQGRRNAVTGQVVVATISLERPEDPDAFDRRARDHCAERLAPHKVPAIFRITACAQHGSRFKTLRADVSQP
jgi:acyl-CoA synthetase (AMP-forming)/AMP-acid ligase II